MSKLDLVFVSVLAPALSSWAGAQEALWRVAGTVNQIGIGDPLCFIGDVDGDGCDDVVITAGRQTPLSAESWILSGRDGALLRVDPAPQPNHYVQDLVATGDMDGDGIGDYAVASIRFQQPFNDNLVTVRSARDGSTIWQISGPNQDEFGWQLAGDLDLDGDGMNDLVVTAPRENTTGAIHAYDHRGRLLYKIDEGTRHIDALGGDLDGDGGDDFLCGADAELNTGSVQVRSGRAGERLVTGFGEQPGDGMGTGDVRGCGDVDGDGWLDFAGSSEGAGIRGIVSVFSGHTGRIIHTWRRPIGSSYGDTLAAGDLDLDGIADLLIYVVLCGGNQALDWRSLRDGEVVKPICQAGNGTSFGASIEIGRPQPGHPFPVILVSEPFFGRGGTIGAQGRIHLLRATPAGVTPLGNGCTGTLAEEPRLGFTDYGTKGIRVHVSNAPPNASSILALGLSTTTWQGLPLPLPLTPFGFTECSLYPSVDLALPLLTDSTGYARMQIAEPLGTLQLTLNGQAIVLGSGATAPGGLTGGLSWQQ